MSGRQAKWEGEKITAGTTVKGQSTLSGLETVGMDSTQSKQVFEALSSFVGKDYEIERDIFVENNTPRKLADYLYALIQAGPARNLPLKPITQHELIENYNTRFCSDHAGNPYFDEKAYVGGCRVHPFLWQPVGILLLLLVVAISAVPGAYCYTWLMEAAWVPDIPFKAMTRRSFFGMLTFVPILLWMPSFSFVLCVAKWVVIGRYQPRNFGFNTWYHMRWWFVDRVVAVWEFFVGCYFTGSPYLVVFYRLLGAKIPIASMLCNVKVHIRGFDLIECGPGTVVDQYFGHALLPHLISIHGFHMDHIRIKTRSDKGSAISPGYNEEDELKLVDYDGRHLLVGTESPAVSKSVVVQKILRPFCYVIIQAGVLFGVAKIVEVATVSADVHVSGRNNTTQAPDQDRTMMAFESVCSAYISQAIVVIIGIVLVRLNNCFGNLLDPTVDFLAGTPLIFLQGFMSFSPWIPLLLKGWGTKVPFSSVHMNTLSSVSPSAANQLHVGKGTCLFTPILSCGGGLTIGKECFVSVGARVDGDGTCLGDNVLIDTLAHVNAGERVPNNCYKSAEGRAHKLPTG